MVAKYPHDWIDASVTDKEYDAGSVIFPAFIAGTLLEMVKSVEYKEAPRPLQRKLSHLSFLSHLMCRGGKTSHFNAIYNHYCEVK